MSLDQSQRAAEPVTPVKESTLIRSLKPFPPDQSATAQGNRKMAADQLGSISALRKSSDFQWYEREFIDKPFRSVSEKLRGIIELDPHETIASVQTTYKALREVKAGLIEREISHRRLLNPNDEEIFRLSEVLDAL